MKRETKDTTYNNMRYVTVAASVDATTRDTWVDTKKATFDVTPRAIFALTHAIRLITEEIR